MSIEVPLYGFGGGGTPLNFAVVDGTAEPSSAVENTIWVNTPNKITGYYFENTQPANMAEGEVWIITGTPSSTEFNALKKNTIKVYPISAKQLVGGVLVDVTAKTYQNGVWEDWGIIFVHEGVEKTSFDMYTGINYPYLIRVTKTQETGQIVYSFASSEIGMGAYGVYYKNVDLTGISTIEIAAKFSTGNDEKNVQLVVLSELPPSTQKSDIDNAIIASVSIPSGFASVSVDVREVNGVHPVGLCIATAFKSMTLTVSDLRCV